MNLVGGVRNIALSLWPPGHAGSHGSNRPVSRCFTPHQAPASMPPSARKEPGLKVATPVSPWPIVQPKRQRAAHAHEQRRRRGGAAGRPRQ